MIDKMKWETFTDFVNRAYELRDLYCIKDNTPSFLMDKYRDYVYSHKYYRNSEAINNICWNWLLSNAYEDMPINDLYSMLGNYKRGT